MPKKMNSMGETTEYVIQGERVRMPVEIRSATNWSAQFVIPAEAARRVLEPTGLVPVQPVPGRALCTVGFVRYVDGDLGPYHEFLIAPMARRPGVRGSLGAYIHWLPVNQSFTCEAGQTIWGFPKEMAQITITPARRSTRCEVSIGGNLVVGLTVGSGLRVPAALPAQSTVAYTFRDGALRQTPWSMNISEMSARPGGAHLSWGDHPIVAQLQQLEIPRRGLMSFTIAKLAMTFANAQVLAEEGP